MQAALVTAMVPWGLPGPHPQGKGEEVQPEDLCDMCPVTQLSGDTGGTRAQVPQ